MASPSLRQLRYCLALAEYAHFGRAAEACSVTQPALSQQIALLEAELGGALFDRMGRAVRPTPLGMRFLELARGVIERADALDAFVASRAGQPARPLRFGLIPTVAPYLLPDIFPALQADHPDLQFQISESRTEALLAGLADASLDLALIATTPPATSPRLASEALFKDPFVLALKSDEAGVGPVPLGEVEGSRMLLLDEGHCFRDQAIAACRLPADQTGRTFAATSLSTIVEFVANGQGVTLLPEIALKKEAGDGRIAIRPLSAPGAGRTLHLVWRHASPRADDFRAIAATIRAAHDGAR